MNKKIIITIAVVVVLAAIAFYFYNEKTTEQTGEALTAERIRANPELYEDVAKEAFRKGITIKEQLALVSKRVYKAQTR